MKLCVFGAGAIGGHLAARLARGGAEVSVVARGANLAAIREKGLLVRAHDGDHHSRPRASDSPAELGPQNAVVVTVKAPALPSVAEGIAPLLGPDTIVAFVMNGIPWWYYDGIGGALEGRRIPELDPGDALRRAIGIERTIGGVVYSACTVVEPGVVQTENSDIRVILGRPDGRPDARAERLAAIMSAGGMPCSVTPDIRAAVWGKLMGNLTSAPLCILSRRTMKETLTNPVVRAAAVRIAEEGTAIAKALGHELTQTPEQRITRSAGIDHKPSILQDLELGRAMEVDAILTLPLRLAHELDVPVPTLELLSGLAMHAASAAGLYAPRATR